jgi:ribosomal protein L44E
VCSLEDLALSHCWQFLTHAATSLLRPCHITLAAMSRLVAHCQHGLAHGRRRTRRATSGTSGLTPPLETSQRSSTPPTTRLAICSDVEEAARCVSGHAA